MPELDPVESLLLDEIRQVRSKPLIPLVSRLAREAGTWRAHADTLAELVRTQLACSCAAQLLHPTLTQLPAALAAALASYDHLVALIDQETAMPAGSGT